MNNMNQTAIVQKFRPTQNDNMSKFWTSDIPFLFEKFHSNANTRLPKLANLKRIKYFELSDKINEFLTLQQNWDSYNAYSISKNAITTALNTLNYLNKKEFLSNDISINVFPMRDGGVQFEFDSDEICAELEISPKDNWTFILYDDNGNILKQYPLFELSEILELLEEPVYA